MQIALLHSVGCGSSTEQPSSSTPQIQGQVSVPKKLVSTTTSSANHQRSDSSLVAARFSGQMTIDGSQEKPLIYDSANQTLTLALPSLSVGNHVFKLEINYESEEYGSVSIVSAQKTIPISEGKNTITFAEGDYQYIDSDEDGFSNIFEIRIGNNPNVSNPNELQNNPTLSTALRTILNMNAEELFSEDLFATIRELDLSFLNTQIRLADISGLNYFYGLTDLKLNQQWNITDLDPISQLSQLNTIELNDVALENFSFLSNNHALTSIIANNSIPNDLYHLRQAYLAQSSHPRSYKSLTNLPNTRLNSLTGLESLQQLHTLSIENHTLVDLSPVNGLTQLHTLNICGNAITELTQVSALALQSISINRTKALPHESQLALELISPYHPQQPTVSYSCQNPLFNFDSLSSFDTLIALDAESAQLTNLDFITAKDTLQILNIANNDTLSPAALTLFTGLKELNIANNGFSALTFIEELAAITDLNISGNGITSLSPLNHLNQLQTLIADNNQITSLTPIRSALELHSLSINNNPDLSDLNHLTALTELSYFSATNNQISQLSPLGGLTNLTVLYLDNNNITDLGPLSTLTNLRQISASDNSITSASAFANKSDLTSINLTNNSINNFDFLRSTPAVTILKIANQSSASTINTSPFATLTEMKDLDLSNNNLANLAFLHNLENANHLKLSNLNLDNLDFVSSLPNLHSLNIDNNPISDLTPLKDHEQLRQLNISATNVANITPINTLKQLTSLTISNSNVTDISPLVSLDQLAWFSANNLSLTDIGGLVNKPNLLMVELENTTLENIDPLFSGDNNKIEHLDLSHNNLTNDDLSDLNQFTELQYLNVADNSIADQFPVDGYQHLFAINLANNDIVQLDLTNLPSLTTIVAHNNPYQSLELFNIGKLAEITAQTFSPRDTNFSFINLNELPLTTSISFANYTSVESVVLSNLTNLNQLDLSGNLLVSEKLARLANLSELQDLNLENNQLTDFTELEALTTLETLALGFQNAVVTCSDITDLRAALPATEITTDLTCNTQN